MKTRYTARNIWHSVHRYMRMVKNAAPQLLPHIDKTDRETMRGRFNFTLFNQRGEIIGTYCLVYDRVFNHAWRFWKALKKACGKQATAQIQLFNLNIK